MQKLRPQRVAARRQQELMCLIKYMDECEDMEQHDKEDLDTEGVTIPYPDMMDVQTVMPVITPGQLLQTSDAV